MDDFLLPRRWVYRLMLVFISMVIVFVHLLPISVGTGGWPAPDLVLAFGYAWVLRRPDYVPVFLFAAIMLMTDMLFLRPPGLWAALAVMGLEFLRSREPFQRDLPFPVEWAMVAAVMTGLLVANRLIQAIFVVNQASLGLSVMQLIGTIVTYPLVVLISQSLLGVSKIAPGELDSTGHRV
ncbi:rod shape-determining protein MreD [Aliiroseovarius sp. PTFE2010]|uniref:rod shape-determining protein MreD n=1 Tax=Aliiroseovarius sp. PTFE2010 TaxID=3417190 RepID=UPI003CEDC1BC